MESIRHLFHINSTAQNVFEAIAYKEHLKKWYTNFNLVPLIQLVVRTLLEDK